MLRAAIGAAGYTESKVAQPSGGSNNPKFINIPIIAAHA
jgi:hypothetical protein